MWAMDKVDRKIKEIKAEQTELDRRTNVEEEALMLIDQCRLEKVIKLLDALDSEEKQQ